MVSRCKALHRNWLVMRNTCRGSECATNTKGHAAENMHTSQLMRATKHAAESVEFSISQEKKKTKFFDIYGISLKA